MDNNQIKQRIKELTDKIPRGTYCDETNLCGGFLTLDEVNELEHLFTLEGQ